MMNPHSFDITEEMRLLQQKMLERGLKSTPQRNELAEWIFRSHAHFSVEDVISDFRKKGKKVSLATVYRMIQTLIDLGILIEHDFGKGYKSYEHTPGHPLHDHLICRVCNRIIEFKDKRMEKISRQIAEKNNFRLVSYSFRIFGICQECGKE